MQKLTLIQKYELQRNEAMALKNMINAKRKKITFEQSYGGCEIKRERPKDKCVAWWFYYETYNCVPESKDEYCSEYHWIDGCENTKCPGYKRYMDYCKALKKYKLMQQELLKYPLWVMIASDVKRKFQKSER